MNQYGQWAGDMYGGPLMDRDAGPPIPNINKQITLDSLMPLPAAFPGLSPSSYGFGIGGTTPLDPYGGRNQDPYVTPNVSEETIRNMMGFVPVAGSVYNWNQMGPVEKGFSVGFDLLDVATVGGSKFITTPLRAAPNPLNVLRLIPGSPWRKPSTFIRQGLPPGSPHYPLPTKESMDYSAANFRSPPTSILETVQPSMSRTLDIPEGGFGTSVNWGAPGGYPSEAGISAYQVLPNPNMAKYFDKSGMPDYQKLIDEGFVDTIPDRGETLDQWMKRVELEWVDAPLEGSFVDEPLYFVRHPEEQGIPSMINRPNLRGTLDVVDPKDPTKKHWRYAESGRLQQKNLGWDEDYGLGGQGKGGMQKGVYVMKGHPVPTLGSDFETLVNPQRITQYSRIDPESFGFLDPEASARMFKDYDIYGRPNVPGGLHPFGFLPDAGLYPWAPGTLLPATTIGRAARDEKDNYKTLDNYINDIVNENLSMWGNYAKR